MVEGLQMLARSVSIPGALERACQAKLSRRMQRLQTQHGFELGDGLRVLLQL